MSLIDFDGISCHGLLSVKIVLVQRHSLLLFLPSPPVPPALPSCPGRSRKIFKGFERWYADPALILNGVTVQVFSDKRPIANIDQYTVRVNIFDSSGKPRKIDTHNACTELD